MGIAGSFCDPDVLQKYFGIRAEWVDEVEILRRIAIGIYDPEEYEKALQWVKANCREGFDKILEKICRKSSQSQNHSCGKRLGVYCEDDTDYPGYFVRQFTTGRAWLA